MFTGIVEELGTDEKNKKRSKFSGIHDTGREILDDLKQETA